MFFMATYMDLCQTLDKAGFMSNAIGMCRREVRAVRQRQKSRVDKFLIDSKTFDSFQSGRNLSQAFSEENSIPGFLRWTHDLRAGTLHPPFPVRVDRDSNLVRQQESLAYGVLDDVIDCLFYRDRHGSEHHWRKSGPTSANDAIEATNLEVIAASAMLSNVGSLANKGRRIGQDKYRKKVLEKWGCCAVTGCKHQGLLKASHIHAWHLATTAERFDEHNGLLLAAHIDAAFEIGLISFADNGRMLFSKNFTMADRESLGLKKNSRLKGLSKASRVYLKRHRSRHHFNTDA